jgi:hypothetical protein
MELAIPLVAAAGLYIASKQKKKENFTGSKLPNIDIQDKNYPSEYENVENDRSSKLSTVNKYDGQQAYTDKYFNENFNEKTISSYSFMDATSQEGNKFTSISGKEVDSEYFKHNNMVPFFGGSMRTKNIEANSNENILDNYIGSGSQHKNKSEQAPLFKPGENTQFPYGAPNNTEFMRSRVNPSSRMANVKPFQSEQVGPGLNLGYTTQGSGGFNSGMMDRELWNAKTVDELRVATNPKTGGNLIYGHEGPANSSIKSMGTLGKQEKNRPDRHFEMTSDRLFTTRGAESGPTMRAEHVPRNVARPDTAVEYGGAASYASSGNSGIYVDGEHQDPHRVQLDTYPIAGPAALGKGVATEADYGMKSKTAYPNNRTTTDQSNYFGAIGGAFGAAVAPILDVLKPSRKENAIGTLRPYQNAKSNVSSTYVFNPNDKPNPTIRETLENKHFLQINNVQGGGAYGVTPHQSAHTTRQDTADYMYVGNSSAMPQYTNSRSYKAEENQRNNDLKSSTIQGRMVQGNMNLYNGAINQKNKAKDSYLINDRPVIREGSKQSPSIDNMGTMNQGQGLYQNIQLERNTPEIMSALQNNPYTIPYKA